MGRVYQQLQWVAKEYQESLLHWCFLGHFCDTLGDHGDPLHPHPGAAQEQGQGQQESQHVGDGRATTGDPQSENAASFGLSELGSALPQLVLFLICQVQTSPTLAGLR